MRDHLNNELDKEEDVEQLYQTYVKCDKHGRSTKFITNWNLIHIARSILPALDLLGHKGVKAIAKRMNRYNCHPYPGLVSECVANEMTLNCPTERFHNTAQCKVTRDYLLACMDYLKYKQ